MNNAQQEMVSAVDKMPMMTTEDGRAMIPLDVVAALVTGNLLGTQIGYQIGKYSEAEAAAMLKILTIMVDFLELAQIKHLSSVTPVPEDASGLDSND